jgi:hypothetical protein
MSTLSSVANSDVGLDAIHARQHARASGPVEQWNCHVISGDNSNSTIANALILLCCAHDRLDCEENEFGGPACSFAPAI